ncbi:MAG: hypothetical protein RIC55_35305 [Pirellulaceae bacterium]
MSNPYSTPSFDSFNQPSMGPGGPSQNLAPGLVNQVRVFAILSIVQGVLEVLMGLFYIGMGFIFPQMMIAAQQNQRNNAPGMEPEQLATFMLILYASFGGATLIAGGLHIFAGIRNYNFEGRVLGFIALGTGLLAVPTCYCMFTGLALGVYGLIVLVNSQVALAFEMRNRGEPVDGILAKFSPYQQQQPYPPR